MRTLWRILKRALLVFVSLLAVLVAAIVLWLWLGHPKRPVDSVFVRPAGEGVFKFTDIPKGRVLSPPEVDGYARKLMAGMTLQEKVLQMSGDTSMWDLIKLITVEKGKYNDRPIHAGANRRLAIPPIAFSDGSRGVILNHSTCFPVAMARGASWDPELERRVGDVVGREIRAQGGNLYGGICINLLRHPSWGRAQETYGEDPYLLGEMGAALAGAVQRHNVMGTAKHYALNSIEETRTKVDARADERTLREVYLPHFKRLVDADVAAVMSAYNKVNGDYCGESHHLLREILKDDWGFRGFVMSDFFAGVYDGAKGANAGLDLEMPWTSAYGKKLITAVEMAQVAPAVIDEAVLRLLRRKIEYATRPDPMAYPASMVRAAEHAMLTREVAEKSMVLLRNEGALLPLDRGRLKTLAVVGPRADSPNLGDYGSSRVYPPAVVTPLEGFRSYLGGSVEVVHETGADLARVRVAVKGADAAVVLVGFDHSDEGEYIPQKPNKDEWGGDREDLALKAADRALVEAAAAENGRTIVVLVGGAAITVEGWRDKVGAILMAFYPGEQGGAALARVLFGDVNPSGKLPFTVPKDPSQLPPFDNRSLSVEYGYYHGYTLLEKKGQEPAYPFGHGLSYTSYAYANLALDAREVKEGGTVEASVDVANTGARGGEEIVQLYVGFAGSKVDRPVKLLRGFAKVALGPGETKRVKLPVKVKDLAYYDPQTKTWLLERMEHVVLVGPSSRSSDLLTACFKVVG
jgi:beta-glucosidase